MKESRDLPRIVAATPVGKEVVVGIFRDGKAQDLTVKVGRLEDSEKQASADSKAKADDAPKPSVQTAFGMQFAPITDDFRKKYSLKDGVAGVAVTAVAPGSAANDKAISPGDVVVEVNQQKVVDPGDVAARIQALKDSGKHSALLLIANAQGEVRFVALSID